MDYLPGTFEWRLITSAFLLCLFVANGKADCPPPSDKSNIVISDEDLLKNRFPEGTKVTYVCTRGFEREEGSGVVTCIQGQWSETDLTCKKKDCGIPPEKPHRSFKYEQEGTLFGAKAQVICAKGYQVRGSSYFRCLAKGWLGKAICEVVTCEKPSVIANGRNSWDSVGYPTNGEVIQYFCDEGYTLIGQSYIECNEDGEYNSQPPHCEAISCPSGVIPFGIVTEDKPPFLLHSKVSYKCEDGYILQGNAELSCEIHGWSSPFPSCTPAILTTVVNVLPTDSITATVNTSTITTTTGHPPVREGTIAMDNNIRSTTHRHQISTRETSPHPIRGKKEESGTSKSTGKKVVAGSVITTVIVVSTIMYIFYRLHIRRKGSYNTGEDLKPELLQFQSLETHGAA